MKVNKSFVISFRSLAIVFALVALTGSYFISLNKSTAQTPPTRIAVIDTAKIASDSKAGKRLFAELSVYQEGLAVQLRSLDAEIRQLEASRNANPSNSAAITTQINNKKKGFEQAKTEAEKKYQAQRDRLMQTLELNVKPVFDQVAKELRIAVAFNKLESGLVYADESIDITGTIILRLDAVTQ